MLLYHHLAKTILAGPDYQGESICWSWFVLDGTEALPELLGNLSSLIQLCLFSCKNLMYLATVQAMRCLTKSKELYISECPKLKERCGKASGVEWSKIAHISEIWIDLEILEGS